MSEGIDVTQDSAAVQDPRRPRWLFYLVLGVTGLFYAYAIWNAIAYLIPLAPLGPSAMTWVALILAAVLPALVYAIAIAITRRRNIGVLAIVLLAGLGVVAVFWLDVVGYSIKALTPGVG